MSRTADLLARIRGASLVRAADMKPGAFGISVDTREQRPWSFPLDVPLVVKKLDVGDYAILGREHECAIERKSLSDFVDSITRGRERFDRALERLRTLPFAAIVVEGSMPQVWSRAYRSRHVPPSLIVSIAARICMRSVPVLFAGPPAFAGDFALRLLRDFYDRATEVAA